MVENVVDTEICRVHAKKRNLHYVKLTKNAKCDGCKACAFGKKNYLVIPALSEIDCEVGDCVSVRMPEKRVKTSYVYLYLVPLLFMFIGLASPYRFGEKFMMIGCAIGLAVGLAVAYIIELAVRRSKKYLPVIISKIENSEES